VAATARTAGLDAGLAADFFVSFATRFTLRAETLFAGRFAGRAGLAERVGLAERAALAERTGWRRAPVVRLLPEARAALAGLRDDARAFAARWTFAIPGCGQ